MITLMLVLLAFITGFGFGVALQLQVTQKKYEKIYQILRDKGFDIEIVKKIIR